VAASFQGSFKEALRLGAAAVGLSLTLLHPSCYKKHVL
jgi:hypothetical protein